MPRKSTPPRCGAHTDDDGVRHPGCGAPILWTFEGPSKNNATWIAVDAADLSVEERLGKPRYDPDVHTQHRCREQSAPVAPPGISPRVYLAGQALLVLGMANGADLTHAIRELAEKRPELMAANEAAFAVMAVRMADAVLKELEKKA